MFIGVVLGTILIVAIVAVAAFGWLAGIITLVICIGVVLFFSGGFYRLMNKLFGVND